MTISATSTTWLEILPPDVQEKISQQAKQWERRKRYLSRSYKIAKAHRTIMQKQLDREWMVWNAIEISSAVDRLSEATQYKSKLKRQLREHLNN